MSTAIKRLAVVVLALVVSVSMAGLAGANSANLAGFWPGEGNANDSSKNGNDGILMFGATFDVGQVGEAFRFDGVDDHVVVPDSPTLDIPGPLTIAAWIKSDDQDATQYIVIKDSETDLGNAFAKVQVK